MILVNVKNTYPDVAALIADHDDRPGATPTLGVANIAALIDITGSGWQQFSPGYLDDYGDYVAATVGATIVGVFRVDSHKNEAGRTRFGLTPAVEAAHLIGAPMPGGPWKRGEGRGTRGVTTPPGVLPLDEIQDADVRGYYGRTRAVAAAFVSGRIGQSGVDLTPTPYTADDTAFTDSATVGGALVRAYPDGVVAVDAPRGMRVVVSHA